MGYTTKEFITLLTNVGFPATVCFILLRHVLQTMGEKLDKLDNSINLLVHLISTFGKREGEYKEQDK